MTTQLDYIDEQATALAAYIMGGTETPPTLQDMREYADVSEPMAAGAPLELFSEDTFTLHQMNILHELILARAYQLISDPESTIAED